MLWRAGTANSSVTLAIVSQSWHCANHELMTGTLETQFASLFEWLAEEEKDFSKTLHLFNTGPVECVH